MFLMICRIVGINEDVIQVDDHANIQEITEDVVHETLESCRSIGKSKGHNKSFKRTIAGLESSFPFITVRNTDEVLGMSDINGGIDTGFTCSGKEVGNEQKGISVFFGYFIETSEIYAEAEGFILRAKITRAPWEEEIWWINPVWRWSSRKLRRTSSSD